MGDVAPCYAMHQITLQYSGIRPSTPQASMAFSPDGIQSYQLLAFLIDDAETLILEEVHTSSLKTLIFNHKALFPSDPTQFSSAREESSSSVTNDEDEEDKTNDEKCLVAKASNEDLASLEYSQETERPYCTDLPTPNDIRRLLELERVVVGRTIKSQTVALNPNQILTKELSPNMKQWEELIRENVFGLRGHRDCLPACLAHMLYCVVAEEQYNLAYFFFKKNRMCQSYSNRKSSLWHVLDTSLSTYKPVDPEVIMEKPATPSLQPPPIITLDLRLTKEMMMRMTVHLVLVPHLLPPILNLFIHSTTKTTIYLPILSKPMKLSLLDKPPCSTKRNECIRRCAEGSVNRKAI
ncbi:hypothetical protein Tco_0511543 [Tanacetum coccineum]